MRFFQEKEFFSIFFCLFSRFCHFASDFAVHSENHVLLFFSRFDARIRIKCKYISLNSSFRIKKIFFFYKSQKTILLEAGRFNWVLTSAFSFGVITFIIVVRDHFIFVKNSHFNKAHTDVGYCPRYIKKIFCIIILHRWLKWVTWPKFLL